MAPHNEKEILRKISQDDERSFKILFDLYYQDFGSYIFKIVESREITEEIVQDVFIAIWERRHSLCNIENFRAYLFVLSRNRAFDYLRKKAKEQTQQLSMLKEIGTEENDHIFDPRFSSEECSLIIEETVAKLPPQQQKVYLLSRYKKLKYEEIAHQMGISRETVKKHMQLALAFLRRHVKARLARTNWQ